jgi:hypothetical protein
MTISEDFQHDILFIITFLLVILLATGSVAPGPAATEPIVRP